MAVSFQTMSTIKHAQMTKKFRMVSSILKLNKHTSYSIITGTWIPKTQNILNLYYITC
jgi:hypothetical protein